MTHNHTHHHDHPSASSATGTAMMHAGHDHSGMVADYRRRFWVCLALTVPILLLSPAGAHGFGFIGAINFPGSLLVLLILSSAVYFYGGWPFLTGLAAELKQRQPGMMTLISLAISVAYIYSTAVVLGRTGTCCSGSLYPDRHICRRPLIEIVGDGRPRSRRWSSCCPRWLIGCR
jgi:Cu2+-exporting ATPase